MIPLLHTGHKLSALEIRSLDIKRYINSAVYLLYFTNPHQGLSPLTSLSDFCPLDILASFASNFESWLHHWIFHSIITKYTIQYIVVVENYTHVQRSQPNKETYLDKRSQCVLNVSIARSCTVVSYV